MQPFTILTGIAAPCRSRTWTRTRSSPPASSRPSSAPGWAATCSTRLRYDADGQERPEFVLNQEPYRQSEILIAHENFGCGSSREHAPWALLDFGIRCVIAPSFADIFHNNTFKNGILPVVLPRAQCDALMEDAQLGGNARVTVDLPRQVVVRPSGEEFAFAVDPFRKHLLLNGLDDIGQTLQRAASIDAYEARRPAWMPSISA